MEEVGSTASARTRMPPHDAEKPKRSLGFALMSGAVFAGLGAAAGHWFASKSYSAQATNIARRWTTAIAALAAGTIAFYGASRPVSQDVVMASLPDAPSDLPSAIQPKKTAAVQAVQHDGVMATRDHTLAR